MLPRGLRSTLRHLRQLTATAALAVVCTGLMSAFAWAQYSSPNLSVAPTIPTPSDDVQLTIMQVTAYGANIDSSSVVTQGSTIEVDAKITFSTFYNIGGAGYTLSEEVGALAEGRYTVRYVARVRQFTSEYGPPKILEEW